jgi:hypothetical protein
MAAFFTFNTFRKWQKNYNARLNGTGRDSVFKHHPELKH